jgi:two-component system OmpR family sensor kinase
VRRGRGLLTVQLAGAISVVVLLVGGVAYLVTTSRQRHQVAQMLDYGLARRAPGTSDPCLYVFGLRDGKVTSPPDAPPGFPDFRLPVGTTRTVTANGTRYTVRTEQAKQAVFDERYQLADRRHLLLALGIAELIGLGAALLTGHVLASRAIRPLVEALTRQRRFVADASHELRTPLTRLQTRAQLLLRWRDGDLPEQARTELERLVTGTRELNGVIDDLLSAARLGGTAPAADRVEMADLVASVADAERARADDRGVTIETARANGPSAVPGVEPALRRMVSALLDNAIRHTPAGGRIRLTVAATDRARTVQLVITDTGDGFDPADRRRIFDRFARGPAGRTGLGLALVREIVLSHGGTVTAAGRPGQGADFTVRLPAARPGLLS